MLTNTKYSGNFITSRQIIINYDDRNGHKSASEQTITIDLKKDPLDRLVEEEMVLVIDDFHAIDPAVQRNLVRALKGPVFEGMRVVLIGIPDREHDAERAMANMGDRVRKLQVPMWSATELAVIADKALLN